jgi:hypothetical protein
MRSDAGSVIDRLSVIPNCRPTKRLLQASLPIVPFGLRGPVVGGPLQGMRSPSADGNQSKGTEA